MNSSPQYSLFKHTSRTKEQVTTYDLTGRNYWYQSSSIQNKDATPSAQAQPSTAINLLKGN